MPGSATSRARAYYASLKEQGRNEEALSFVHLLKEGMNVASARATVEATVESRKNSARRHYDRLLAEGDQDQANRFLNQIRNGVPVHDAVRRASMGADRGAVSTFAEGVLFNWSDELRSQALQLFHGLSPDEAAQEVNDDRLAREELAQQSPEAATALQVGGGLAGALFPVGAGALGAAGGGLRGLAAVGAAEGALAGAGAAEEGGRARGGAQGALVGAVTAPAVGGALSVASRGVTRVLRGQPRLGGSPGATVTQQMRGVQQIEDQLTQAGQAGVLPETNVTQIKNRLNDLFAEQPEVAERMTRAVDEWLQRGMRGDTPSGSGWLRKRLGKIVKNRAARFAARELTRPLSAVPVVGGLVEEGAARGIGRLFEPQASRILPSEIINPGLFQR